MGERDDGAVSVQAGAPRSFAAVRARVPAGRVGAVFATYLDQVYAAGRGGLVQLDGQNIFVYRSVPGLDAEIDVDFGVGIRAPFADTGSVQSARVPEGNVATATHRGDYRSLGETHRRIVTWCEANGHTLAGPRWEIYGHWNDDPALLRTDVYYLLR